MGLFQDFPTPKNRELAQREQGSSRTEIQLMAEQETKAESTSSDAGEPAYPSRAKINIRPLTEAEIERLERALGKPIDRSFLTHWLSVAIEDTVRLSTQPTAKEFSSDLRRMARHGRQWLRGVDEYFNAVFRRRSSTLEL